MLYCHIYIAVENSFCRAILSVEFMICLVLFVSVHNGLLEYLCSIELSPFFPCMAELFIEIEESSR